MSGLVTEAQIKPSEEPQQTVGGAWRQFSVRLIIHGHLSPSHVYPARHFMLNHPQNIPFYAGVVGLPWAYAVSRTRGKIDWLRVSRGLLEHSAVFVLFN